METIRDLFVKYHVFQTKNWSETKEFNAEVTENGVQMWKERDAETQ